MSEEHVTANPHAAPSHAITEHAHGSSSLPFSEAELDMLHAQDVAAGRAVVTLMCSIFLLGVFIYTIVAITVAY